MLGIFNTFFCGFFSETQEDNIIPQFKNMLCRLTQEDN